MRPRASMELGDITHHNVLQLKRLNQVIFPVSYNDKFYKDVLEAGELAKFVYYNDIIVGAVCCRIDTTSGRRQLYIMTLGCFAPYRRLGLGTLMLSHVLHICERDPSIESIFLHVQVSNEGALEFYKKSGFVIIETAENYYKRIEPPDAYVLEKRLKESIPRPISGPDNVQAKQSAIPEASSTDKHFHPNQNKENRKSVPTSKKNDEAMPNGDSSDH